jgi:alcohol dehydrogenase
MRLRVQNPLKKSSDYSTFRIPPTIIFGSGCAKEIGPAISKDGYSKVFMIADANVSASGNLDPIVSSLSANKIEYQIFKGVVSEPTIKNLYQPLSLLRETEAEIVVGIGGGSTIDTAKAVSIIGKLGGSPQDYIGIEQVPAPGFPLFALPTTSGTGSEVSPGCVLIDTERNEKVNILSRFSIPNTAIIDPLLTLSAPSHIVANAGMDALAHAIESYTSPKATHLTEMYSLEAIRIIFTSLPKAVGNSSDIEAFSQMALGSLYAGIAMSNAGGAGVHALAYPLSAYYELPHGFAIGLLLAHVIEFNLPACIGKYSIIGQTLLENKSYNSKINPAEYTYNAIKKLGEDVNLPSHFKQSNATDDLIAKFAMEAVAIDRLISNNPRNITFSDAVSIYRKVLQS